MIIKREHVQLEPAGSAARPAREPLGRQTATASARAAVRLIELGGETRGIELVCSCGAVHALELELEPPAGHGPGAEAGKGGDA